MLSYIKSDKDRAKSYITLAQEKKLFYSACNGKPLKRSKKVTCCDFTFLRNQFGSVQKIILLCLADKGGRRDNP